MRSARKLPEVETGPSVSVLTPDASKFGSLQKLYTSRLRERALDKSPEKIK